MVAQEWKDCWACGGTGKLTAPQRKCGTCNGSGKIYYPVEKKK